MTRPLIKTLGELKSSGYSPLSVKDELRKNLLESIASGSTPFKGVVGFEDTAIPQIYNAILARHNFILLGLRGQAKTRLIRQLPNLLDEYSPRIAGSALNESPFSPITPRCKKLVCQRGEDVEIEWMSREERFQEKLATPDVTIADLIGDIDPIKAAREKLDISDEEVIHWGILPRTNNGIFAINELSDLQPRIQVGLLNIMEEGDIQVRGFPIRVALDILLVFTANPEDYTNRGNIITPLKDRIDSQIITHYPKSIKDSVAITKQEAWSERGSGIKIPDFTAEIIENISSEARASEYVDQSSGVSARVSIAAMECLISAVERRATANREKETVPRISDLYATLPALTGKMELVYEGELEGPTLVATSLIGKAIKIQFERYFPAPSKKKRQTVQIPGGAGLPETNEAEGNPYEAVTDYFGSGLKLDLNDKAPLSDYRQTLDKIAGLKEIVSRHFQPADSDENYLRMEFVLEGLHQFNVLAKDISDANFSYTDMLANMLRDVEVDS